jgi:transcription-repair coupling factor (superfamily II helicase)
VARLRLLARGAGVSEIVAQGNHIRLAPVELPESRTMRLTRLYPGSIIKPAVRTILVPRPTTARVGGQPLRDDALLAWVEELLAGVVMEPAVEPTKGTA